MKTDAIKKCIDVGRQTGLPIPHRGAMEELLALERSLSAAEKENAALREALDPDCGHRNSEGYDAINPASCCVRCVALWRCIALSSKIKEASDG